MFLLIVAAGLCLLTVAGLARGVAGNGRMVLEGFDGTGVMAAFVATAVGALFFGPVNALALVAALLLHEAGHYLGARICGRDEAPFRLIPAFGSFMPDDSDFARDSHRFFHVLMGAGISIAPMVLAIALALALRHEAPQLARFCRAFALSIAMVNGLNLMPFRPLDGGRCVEIAARTLSPVLPYICGGIAVAGLGLLALFTGMGGLFGFAGAGLLFLILRAPVRLDTEALSEGEARLAILAWASTLAAHLAGGMTVFQSV